MIKTTQLLLAAALLATPFAQGCEDSSESAHDTSFDTANTSEVHLRFARSVHPDAQHAYITVSDVRVHKATGAGALAFRRQPDKDATPDEPHHDDGDATTNDSWVTLMPGPVTFDVLNPNLGVVQALLDVHAPALSYDQLSFTIESATLVRNGVNLPIAIDPLFHAGIEVSQPLAFNQGQAFDLVVGLDLTTSLIDSPETGLVLRPQAKVSLTPLARRDEATKTAPARPAGKALDHWEPAEA
jgi:hypothetical protein